MSASNGVFVLHTKDGYRVNYCANIDALYMNIDDNTYKWIPSLKVMKEVFGQSNVYSTKEDALRTATLMASFSEPDTLEWGVAVLENFSDMEFPNG